MTKQIIVSERLYLKEFTQNDVNDYFRLNSDADVMKFIRPPDIDIKAIKGYIKKKVKYYAKHTGFGNWACFEKEGDEFIGFFELAHLDNTEEIEVGYRLHKEFWGIGYATEMTKILIEYGFNNLNLDKIVAITHPENFSSQNVLLKSGLKYVKNAVFYGFLDKYYVIVNERSKQS